MKLAVVTDSSVYLPQDFVQKKIFLSLILILLLMERHILKVKSIS